MNDPHEIQVALAAPFPPEVVGWKAQAVKGDRCLAVAYIDARDVEDRLDSVVGVDAWSDEYRRHPDGCVECTLRIRINGQWIAKADVGGPSDQSDVGDKCKAAFSDALKRAAVKWGIGRYIYRLDPVWTEYDPQRKQIVGTPRLPANARPTASTTTTKPTPARPASNGHQSPGYAAWEAAAVKEGACRPGELVGALTEAMTQAHGPDESQWPKGAAAEWARGWVTERRAHLVVTAEQEATITAELKRTRRTWPDCRAKLDMPVNTSLGDLRRGQADELIRMLKETPNASR